MRELTSREVENVAGGHINLHASYEPIQILIIGSVVVLSIVIGALLVSSKDVISEYMLFA